MPHPFPALTRASRFGPALACAVALLLLAPLRAQNNWSADPQNVTRAHLWGVGYGNDILIAVGENGTILRFDYNEPDWQARFSESSAWLLGAAYGNGRWVIVGDAGTLLVSTDEGDSWLPRNSGVSVRLNAVAYGNGRWLAVGEQGTVVTSTDAETWTVRPSLGTGFLRGLAFGQNVFLFGGAGGALYATSDGETFLAQSPGTTSAIEAIAIADGRYYIAGSDGLLGSSNRLGNILNIWSLQRGTPATATFRGLVARSASNASAVGDGDAYAYFTTWGKAPLRPDFLATAATLGREEAIAVGFNGGIARASSLVSVSIAPLATMNVVYGGELRLTAVPAGATTNLSYQWQRDGANLPGMTAAQLVLAGVGPADSGSYTVRASAGGPALVASSVRVNVVPGGRPDIVDTSFNYPFDVAPGKVLPAPGGGLYVNHTILRPGGGYLTTAARLLDDGTIDSTFRPAAADAALTIERVLPDGRILASGRFPAAVGQPEVRTAVLLPDGALDPAFANVGPQFRLETLAPTTAGGFFVQTTGGIVRLSGNGSIDPSFPAIRAGTLSGADSQGRLFVSSTVTIRHSSSYAYSTSTLRRHLADGALDPTFVHSFSAPLSTPVGSWTESLGIIDDWLFWRVIDRGKLFGSERGAGVYTLDSRRTVGSLGAVGSQLSFVSWLPQRNGSIWEQTILADTSSLTTIYGARMRFYGAPNGGTGRTYGTMADLTDYRPLGGTADGAIYALPNLRIMSAAPAKRLVRIRPVTGDNPRLTNLSVRAHVTTAEALIVGFVTSGSGSTRALVRGIGPTLAPFGVGDALRDPALALRRDTAQVGENDNWEPAVGARFASLGAFPLPANSRDAAIEAEIASGNYTAVLSPADGGSGTALVELFEAADGPAPGREFVNVSARGPVSPDRPLIVGFTLTGGVPATVLIRGAGPALTRFGVTSALTDPTLKLYRQSTALWENDNWNVSGQPVSVHAPDPDVLQAERLVGAFPLVIPFPGQIPSQLGSRDAAMVITLAPGSYTAQVSASGTGASAAGTALVEVYIVPTP